MPAPGQGPPRVWPRTPPRLIHRSFPRGSSPRKASHDPQQHAPCPEQREGRKHWPSAPRAALRGQDKPGRPRAPLTAGSNQLAGAGPPSSCFRRRSWVTGGGGSPTRPPPRTPLTPCSLPNTVSTKVLVKFKLDVAFVQSPRLPGKPLPASSVPGPLGGPFPHPGGSLPSGWQPRCL